MIIAGTILRVEDATYHGTGPDVDEHGAPVHAWYEIYPGDEDGVNRTRHVLRPDMDFDSWREIAYRVGR